MPTHLPLHQQVALITGGSSGIGKALALLLAQLGTTVVLTGRRVDALETAKAEILAQSPQATVTLLAGDVSDPDTCDRWVKETLAAHGALHTLVNNAGICMPIGLLQELSAAEVAAMVAINLQGPIYLTQAALKHAMVPNQHGTLLYVNSIAGKSPFPYWAVYDATKAGLKSLSEAVQEEQRMNHIRVMSLYPAAVATPLWEPMDDSLVPDDDGMLPVDAVAQSALFMLQQPHSVVVSDITLSALHPTR